MRLRILTAVLLFVVGGLSVKAFVDQGDGETSRLAVINIDRTPLDRGDSTVVTSYADVLDQVRPAVVSVASTRVVRQRSLPAPFRDFFGEPEGREREQRRQGLGSGVIVSPNGYILTNNHVIEGADEIEIVLGDQRRYEATVVGTDPQTDVAILKIEAEELPVAVLADSEQIRVGDIVFALGNPLGVGQTVTMGIVSATGRMEIGILGRGSYENFIQTDAAINQGNSGGPLVDASGRVIGINTAILSRTGGNIGIGFAIPVSIAANVMESLIETGTVERGYIGVFLQPLTPELAEEFGIPGARGALIGDVVAGGAADRAGIERGDVIVRVGDQAVSSHTALRLLIGQMRPGEATEVEVIRDEERHVMEVTLDRLDAQALAGQRSRPAQRFLEGITVSPVTSELREEYELPEDLAGVVVTEVAPNAPHAEDLPVGSVIIEINRQKVSNVRSARDALQPGRNIFVIHYQGSTRYVLLTI